MIKCNKCGREDHKWNFPVGNNGYVVRVCKPCIAIRQREWRRNADLNYYNLKSVSDKERRELTIELKKLQGFYDKVFNVLYKCFIEGKIGSDVHMDAVKVEREIHKKCNRIRAKLNDGTQDVCRNNPCSKCAYYIRDFSRGDIGRAKDGCNYKRNVLDNNGVFKGFMRRNENYVKI